ncbi:MAG: hypothetical protein M1812_003740 [Candelaria pacifica]|nr:MAG: hypothetical protein M1812_003740 [Candelaria pacifica]
MSANIIGQGSGPTQYAVPPARGEDAADYTSFLRAQALYSIENLPDIIYQRDIGWGDVNDDEPPLEYNGDGSAKIDNGTGKQFRRFDVLPVYIATVVEGWRVECWYRWDNRIEYSDILMRMTDDGRPTPNNLNMIRGRFRFDFWLRAWDSGGLSTNQHNGEQFNMLTPQQKAFAWTGNSTRTMTPGLVDPTLGEAGRRIAVPAKYIAAQEAAIRGPTVKITGGARQRIAPEILNNPPPQRTTANHAIQHGGPSIMIPYRQPGQRAPRPRMGRYRVLPARPHPTRAGAIRPTTRSPELANASGGRTYTWGITQDYSASAAIMPAPGAMLPPPLPSNPLQRPNIVRSQEASRHSIGQGSSAAQENNNRHGPVQASVAGAPSRASNPADNLHGSVQVSVAGIPSGLFNPAESFAALYDDNGQAFNDFETWARQRETRIAEDRSGGSQPNENGMSSDDTLQEDWAEYCARRRER